MFNMRDNVPPCKNCNERSIGCHCKCDRYIDWKLKHQSIREKVFKNNDIKRQIIDSKYKYLKRKNIK